MTDSPDIFFRAPPGHLQEWFWRGPSRQRSAEPGGAPLHVPDIRRQPFEHTGFWDHVGLPEDEPEGRKYESDSGMAY